MKFDTCFLPIFSCLWLGLRVGAAAVHHCHSCGGVPTSSTSVLDFEHIATVTASVAPLPTEFHYPDYLYLQSFQLLKCSSFPSNSTAAKACSSGSMALFSTGSGTMNFGTPDDPRNSNARYMNVSSMRITNLEDEDVYVYLQYMAPYVYGGGLPFEMQSYQFKVPKGSPKLLVDGLEKAGLTYVQLLIFNCYKGQVDLTQPGSARLNLLRCLDFPFSG
ncbi:hypothetical protein V1504DRAFT_86394 [Lipomyces starkeyi]